MTDYPYPPFPEQEQDLPGSFRRMDPVPDTARTAGRATAV